MKLYTTISLLLLISVVSFGQQAKIKFESLVHDFGLINESDGIVTYEFKFKNIGEAPLIINHVQTSCGCTTPGWNKAPIIPGQSSIIRIRFNPANRPGLFNKKVRVLSNSTTPTTILSIKGTVKERERTLEEIYRIPIGKMRVKNRYLPLTEVLDDEIRIDTIEYVNISEEPLKLSVKQKPDHITAQFVPEQIAPKEKGHIIVRYDAKMKNNYGYHTDRIYLKQNDEGTYQYSIGITATIMENFKRLSAREMRNAPVIMFDNKTFNFGEITEGDKIEHVFKIKNKGKSELIIRRIRTSCGCTIAQPEKKILNAGEETKLRVTFNSRGKVGRQSKPITIITNDPNNSMTSLRVMGIVRRKS